MRKVYDWPPTAGGMEWGVDPRRRGSLVRLLCRLVRHRAAPSFDLQTLDFLARHCGRCGAELWRARWIKPEDVKAPSGEFVPVVDETSPDGSTRTVAGFWA